MEEEKSKNVCGKCGRVIVGAMVLSPNLDEKKRMMCVDCAFENIEPQFKCKKLMVPENICYVAFFNERGKWKTYQEEIGVTVRDELVILDFNEKHEIIGIELIGSKKPCQQFSVQLKDSVHHGGKG